MTLAGGVDSSSHHHPQSQPAATTSSLQRNVDYLRQSYESWKTVLDSLDDMLVAASSSTATCTTNINNCPAVPVTPLLEEWKTVLLLQRCRLDESYDSCLSALQSGLSLGDTSSLRLQLDSIQWRKLFQSLLPSSNTSSSSSCETAGEQEMARLPSSVAAAQAAATAATASSELMNDEQFEIIDSDSDPGDNNNNNNNNNQDDFVCVGPSLPPPQITTTSTTTTTSSSGLGLVNKTTVGDDDDIVEDDWVSKLSVPSSSASSDNAGTGDDDDEDREEAVLLSLEECRQADKASNNDNNDTGNMKRDDNNCAISRRLGAVADWPMIGGLRPRPPPQQRDLKNVRDRIMARFQLLARLGHHLARDAVTEVLRRALERDVEFVHRPLPHIYETVKVLLPVAVESAKSKYQAPHVGSKLLGRWTFKTKLCLPFVVNGACQHGADCLYAHGDAELRPKRRVALCHQWEERGYCPRRAVCLYAHGKNELGRPVRLL